MSSKAFLSPPVRAELPDWVLALKRPGVDEAILAPTETAVFSELDAELEALSHTDPEELAWLAEDAERTYHLMSRNEAAAILDGEIKPEITPRPKRRRRPNRIRQSELVVLDVMLILMILIILIGLFVLFYVLRVP